MATHKLAPTILKAKTKALALSLTLALAFTTAGFDMARADVPTDLFAAIEQALTNRESASQTSKAKGDVFIKARN